MEFSPSWRIDDDVAHAEFRGATYSVAAHFIAAVGAAADAADHHPEVTLRYPGIVGVSVTSHDVGRLTGRDERFAATVDGLARNHGMEPVT